MTEEEFIEIVRIFNSENDDELIRYLNIDGINSESDILTDEQNSIVESAIEELEEKIRAYMEANLERVRQICLRQENTNAFNRLSYFFPMNIRKEISSAIRERQSNEKVEQISSAENAEKYIIENFNLDRENSIKLAKKFFGNNEEKIWEFLQNGCSYHLIDALDNLSDKFIYKCVIKYKENTFIMDSIISKYPGRSNELLVRLFSDENLNSEFKLHLLNSYNIEIPESLALEFLSSIEDISDSAKKKLLLSISHPSDDLLYSMIVENMKDTVFLKKLIEENNVPTEILYKSIFAPVYTPTEEGSKKDFLRLLLQSKENDKSTLEQLLYEYLKQPVTDENLEQKRQILLKMYAVNDEVLESIDFRILDRRYVDRLGIEKINNITAGSTLNNNIQKKLLKLDAKEYEVVVAILDKYLQDTNEQDWNNIFSAILLNIGTCKKLIQNIDDISQNDLYKLSEIILHKNVYQIEEKEDLENFEDFKKQYFERLLSSNELDKIKQAIYLKKYGLSKEQVSNIIEKFAKDIEFIKNDELKRKIKELIAVGKSVDISQLKDIFFTSSEEKAINGFALQRKLKNEYGMLINEGLLDPNRLEQIDRNIYKAGTRFNILMTSVGAYSGKHDGEKQYSNYYEDWNRPKLGCSHFCSSYIRNDMIGTAEIGGICFGFSNMSEDSMLLMGNSDISSNSWTKSIITRN